MVLFFELVSFKQETANDRGFVTTYLPYMQEGVCKSRWNLVTRKEESCLWLNSKTIL